MDQAGNLIENAFRLNWHVGGKERNGNKFNRLETFQMFNLSRREVKKGIRKMFLSPFVRAMFMPYSTHKSILVLSSVCASPLMAQTKVSNGTNKSQ